MLCSGNKGADQLHVTMQLICAFVFANVKNRFSHDAADTRAIWKVRSMAS